MSKSIVNQITSMSERRIEQLAASLYAADPAQAMALAKAIGFEDMEAMLDSREGVAV